MNKKKLKQRFEQQFGATPDTFYYHGDMEYIEAYYKYRKANQPDEFMIDDITWCDLSMDNVFKRINPSLSTSGEQYLYYTLRHPATDKSDYDERKKLIDTMENNPKTRLDIQMILAKLGRTRRADLSIAFNPGYRGYGWLLVYITLALIVVVSLALISVTPKAAIVAVIAGVFNSIFREFTLKKIQKDFDTVNYSVSMVLTLNSIKKLRPPELESLLSSAYKRLEKLRSVLRSGGVAATGGNELGDIICSVLLLDLINYEFLKNKLWICHDDIFAVHETLGILDTAIAIASYRKSMAFYAVPDLRFEQNHASFVSAEKMVHPLIKRPVSNGLDTNNSLLITGSNASGKSTYLKTTLLCAVLAQSICTCPAERYSASAFHIYSSMAIADDVLAGDSYYISEIKSIKRIMDAAAKDSHILCVVDEVLRGTNTIERIAASSEVLRALKEKGALCIAATHDIELCGILDGIYDLYHFEERFDNNSMIFDYRIRPGSATSRNAIKLLAILGFEEKLVDGANNRAQKFVETGTW